MVINKDSKGISYKAMINSKNLNSFFPKDSDNKEEEE